MCWGVSTRFTAVLSCERWKSQKVTLSDLWIRPADWSQIGPGSYRYTGSRIRHFNPFPQNPTTEKPPKSLSGMIGAGRDQKSRLKVFVLIEICRNIRLKAFGHKTCSADKELSILSGFPRIPVRAGTYQSQEIVFVRPNDSFWIWPADRSNSKRPADHLHTKK